MGLTSEDLWIGDRVTLLKSKRRGVFEGVKKSGKAIVNISGKKVITTFSNLALTPDEKTPVSISLKEEESTSSQPLSFKNEIDLHIEKLAPDLANAIPQIILQKQINATDQFIKNAIRSRMVEVLIIHGVGTGLLKAEVQHLLEGHKELHHFEVVNEGGATSARFNYQ